MNPIKVYIRSNGCPGRDLDKSRLTKYFEKNGCTIVPWARLADYIIFVTCSFKESRKDDSLDHIRKYQSYGGELIVAGCLPDIAPEDLSRYFNGKFVSTKNLEQIDRYFPQFEYPFNRVDDANFLYPRLSDMIQKVLPEIKLNKNFLKQLKSFKMFSDGKQIPYLRVGQGCNEKCAYCGIRKAIGPLKSKTVQDIADEYAQLLAKGYRKIKFFSDNVGAYGMDMDSSLSDLLRALSEIRPNGNGGNHRIEWLLLHLYPRWAIQNKDEIIKRIKEKTITEILFPIQSGSVKILKLMNRYPDTEASLSILHEFKRANPLLKLYSQVIVGFPNETEDDFMDTVQFVRKAGFDLVIPFEYYDSPHTMSYDMMPKVEPHIISERMKRFGQYMDNDWIHWLTL